MKKTIRESFHKNASYAPRNEREKLLIRAVLSLKDEKEAAHFLRDILTLPEIEEFSNRLTIAQMLLKGQPYQKIADAVGTSTTTVTRVAHWVYNGCGGYYTVLKRLIRKFNM